MNAALTPTFLTPQPAASTQLLYWQEPMATRLRYRHDLPGQLANRLLNVELGLFLLEELLPTAPPEALPDLLNGQGKVYEQRPAWTPRQHRNLNRARTLLAPYRNRNTWYNALEKYITLPTWLRVYSLNGRNYEVGSFTMRERLTLFQRALA